MEPGYFIVAILSCVLIGVIAYIVMRSLKGDLKVEMDQFSFSSGDRILGKVRLLAKKEIEGNSLTVSLNCQEVVRYRENDKTSTQYIDLYEDKIKLEGSRTYPAGFRNAYDFEFEAPAAKQVKKTESREADSDLQMAASILVGASTRRRIGSSVVWSIEADLDAKGVDLSGSENVRVDLK